MDQIKIWRQNKNKISDHKIKIGELNEVIGDHNIEIGNHNIEIGLIRDKIGQIKDEIGIEKEHISICENKNRETPYYWVSQWVNNNLPSYFQSFEDSVSQGQFESKIWLMKELSKISMKEFEPLKIDIIGSWFAFPLIEMLSKLYKIDQIDLYDIDENCHKVVAQYLNHFDYDFKVVQFGDYFERKDLRRRHIVINTSSEHMPNVVECQRYYKNYPENPLLVLQSNNYFQLDEHTNCVNDENELIKNNSIERVYYKGKNPLPLYDRFMVIGRW
mgnify:FL=1